MNYLSLIDRTSELLEEDISEHSKYLHGIISKSSFWLLEELDQLDNQS